MKGNHVPDLEEGLIQTRTRVRSRRSFVAIGAVVMLLFATIVIVIRRTGLPPFIDSVQQRAGKALLEEVIVPSSFIYRDRVSYGNAKRDFNDFYIGPAGEVDLNMLVVPDEWSSPPGKSSLVPDEEYRYLEVWEVESEGFECHVRLALVLDDVMWRTYANLGPEAMARVRSGELAVIEISSLCL